MKAIANERQEPMFCVGDATDELRRLSDLCAVLTNVGDSPSLIKPGEIGNMMILIRAMLDRQIDALDSIQWPESKAVGA